jgi:hypothetical protein
MVERIDRQKGEPNPGPYRASVLTTGVLGSLPAQCSSN